MQARNLVKTQRCPGCKCLFELPVRARAQKYCHERCRERARLGPQKQPPHIPNETPFTDNVIRFREELFRLAPARCIGYKLYSLILQLWLPLPGRSKRYSGNLGSLPYYLIDPFEPPRVKFTGKYEIVWIQPGGRETPKGEIFEVEFAFENIRSPAIQKAVKLAKKPLMVEATSEAGLLPDSAEDDAGPLALLSEASQTGHGPAPSDRQLPAAPGKPRKKQAS